MNSATIPTPLVQVPPDESTYLKRFHTMTALVPDAADLILLGDSLAASWPAALHPEAFPGRRVLNVGLTGNRVQNTLWRLGAMNIHHLRPREVVRLLGTNNLSDGDEAEAIARGIEKVLSNAQSLWSESQAFVVTVTLRGLDPGRREAVRPRLNNRSCDELLSSRCTVLIEADVVLDCLPSAHSSFLPDLLHLSQYGYRRLSGLCAAPGRPQPQDDGRLHCEGQA